MRRVIFISLMILLMVITTACGSENPDSDLSSSPRNQDPVGSEENEPQESIAAELPPIEQVNEVAAVIYQGIITGENVVGFIEEIYEAIGIPVLDPETEMELIEAAIENKTTFTLESHLELITNALASGVYLDLESFVAEINHQGFYALDTGGEVTLEYLSQNLAYLLDQNQFAPEETQIALVLALGRTRSDLLYGENQDPVWGDDLLDPLQSSLLWHLLDQVAADAQAKTSQGSVHLGALTNPQRRGPLGDLLGSLTEAGQYTINFCNNARIFGHQSTLTLSEYQIYRITDDPGKPIISQATFSVEFTYKPSSAADKLTVLAGCPDLPAIGPRPDISVDWEIRPNGDKKPGLLDLGAFSPGESTNDQGISEANYLANPEVVPADLQQDMNLHYSDGTIRATAKLYPDNEIIMTIISTYPDRQDIESKYLDEAYLSVGYYTFPTIMWSREDGFINMEGVAWSCDGVNWVASHVFNQTLPGLTVFTSAEFEFTMPEFPFVDEIKSNPIKVVFTGTWDTPDGPVPVTDTREVWLSITGREITMNFEPLGATATYKGQTIDVGAAFVFRSIPTEMMINTHCDGE